MKKLLIVVDYQNDFVKGSLGFPEAVLLEAKIVDKIQQYRANGDDVIFTFDTHDTNYAQTQEGHFLPVAHCLCDTDGWKLYGAVAGYRKAEDLSFAKTNFGSEALFDYLRKVPFLSIELVGVVSNICVLSNAVLAKTAAPETLVIVDASCVASNDKQLNAAALDVLQSLQIQVINRGVEDAV
ncbi:MAG TPA: cysteine hydrolase family protein [Bacillota bacterium]|nr:cysteine hydrolase family protein [Bacillota bacterium]